MKSAGSLLSSLFGIARAAALNRRTTGSTLALGRSAETEVFFGTTPVMLLMRTASLTQYSGSATQVRVRLLQLVEVNGLGGVLKKSFASRLRAQAECLCHENSRRCWPPWHGLQSVQDFFSTLLGAKPFHVER